MPNSLNCVCMFVEPERVIILGMTGLACSETTALTSDESFSMWGDTERVIIRARMGLA